MSAPRYESLFHDTTIDLLVPTYSSLLQDTTPEEWFDSLRDAPPRQISFLDEKLFYVVLLSIPDDVFSTPNPTSEPPSDLLRFLSRLQLSMTASFLPPLASRPHSLQVTSTPNPNSLAPPKTPHMPTTPDTASSGLPVTPMPQPSMDADEEQYASVEGVTVWDGPVQELKETLKPEFGGEIGNYRGILKKDGRWEVTYKGQVPVVYIRTQIVNPVLSLTASVTLRDAPVKKKHANAETSSIFSNASTVRTDGTDGEEEGFIDEDDLAGMQEIDLLGGLGDEKMPSSRLAMSVREDLSLPSLPTGSSAPSAAITPQSLAQGPATSSSIPSTAGPSRERQSPFISTISTNTTLRKSYRRILALSSGLRVRMRTLFLPQLLPPQLAGEDDTGEEGERRVALCVEVENPLDDPAVTFEVEKITVDVGGKGGKASAELLCQPEQHSTSSRSNSVFPLRLDPVEQYNLLYAVSIASTSEDRNGNGQGVEEALARTLGKGDEQRPVAITVIGRPKLPDGAYPTDTFNSRWNCTLDLAPFYAGADNAVPPSLPRASMKAISIPPNAVVGDKRYSLATMAASVGPRQGPLPQRAVSGPRPPIGAPGSRVSSLRVHSQAGQTHGLMLSVKVLDDNGDGVKVLQPFSLEVFVHNRTDEVRRFRLSIPPAEQDEAKIRDVLARRRKRREDEPSWGLEDSVLKHMLSSHLGTAPALVPLEDEIRCGPILPGASMSARIRFLALREGLHTLDKLRVTGANEEFDFIMSPVLGVVVGHGVDHH